MSTITKIESVLESVKKVLGLAKEYTSFDPDILIYINSVFSDLTQMGVGPSEGFTIDGYDETWGSYTTSNQLKTQQIKAYVILKVKTLFDPTSNGNVHKSIKDSLAEMEYRLFVEEENSSDLEKEVA